MLEVEIYRSGKYGAAPVTDGPVALKGFSFFFGFALYLESLLKTDLILKQISS